MAVFEASGLVSLHVGPLDFHIEDGGCVGLTGPSGSGKSLLLRALADLDPHGGRASLDGVEQAQTPGPDWRRRVGYLPADSHWWAPVVGDHFDEQPDWLADEIASLGLPGEVMEWTPERLSSGEKQRLAFLRLLSVQPEVFLLDEPTANLDVDVGSSLERIVERWRKERGVSVVWVSHDFNQLERVADSVVVLEMPGNS